MRSPGDGAGPGPHQQDDRADRRGEMGRQLRIWGLSLVCATIGATVVWATGSLPYGVIAFAVTVAVLGTLLWRFEKSRKGRRQAQTDQTRT